jgi:hypothetical protein
MLAEIEIAMKDVDGLVEIFYSMAKVAQQAN